MGSYISKDYCEANFGIKVNCDGPKTDNDTTVSVGGVVRGQFESDPDIAGIGIVAVFIAVTTFALFISVLDIVWLGCKYSGIKKRHSRQRRRLRVSVTDIYEALILSCSDQQVFTGAAYVVTLRYYKGCQVSAYHYNIVANMMLLTCATHLMSVTVVRNYWKYPVLAVMRILVITGVFLATGLLLSNQNVDEGFPTKLPVLGQERTEDSLIFLPAACFMGDTHLKDSVKETTSSGQSFIDALLNSQTSANFIQGWNTFLAMGIWYGAVMIAEIIRLFCRGRHRAGWRRNVVAKLGRAIPFFSKRPRLMALILALYWVVGFAISGWTVIVAAGYIINLRRWVGDSGWIQQEDGQTNPEDEAASFGQLVPIFMTSLTLFSFIQIIHEKYSAHKKWKKWQKYDEADLEGASTATPRDSSLDKRGPVVRQQSVQPTTTNTDESLRRAPYGATVAVPSAARTPVSSTRGTPAPSARVTPVPSPRGTPVPSARGTPVPSLRGANSAPQMRQLSGASVATAGPPAFGMPATSTIGTAR